MTESAGNSRLTWQQQGAEPMHTHGNATPAFNTLHAMHTTKVYFYVVVMDITKHKHYTPMLM